MSERNRVAALVGGAAGFAAIGAMAGVALERRTVGRARRRAIRAGRTPYGSVRGQSLVVQADDGVPLHVEVDETGAGPGRPTIVLSHGYCLSSDSWHYQRIELADLGRIVTWDQRGHGRSGRGARDTANIDQLGHDLRAVLDEVSPDGPLVLVGHSMGGMTIMALADSLPEIFKERVHAVGLISTSAGKLSEVSFGAPAALGRVLHRVAPGVVDGLGRRAALVERGRSLGSDLAYVLTKRYAFHSDVPPALVEFSAAMIEATPIEVVAEFFPAFDSHDKLTALPVLDGIETLIMVGENDLLTPADHSRSMVDVLHGAELVVIPDCGHLSMLEHPEIVNAHLRELIVRGMRA